MLEAEAISLSYATVRDYCDSADRFPRLMAFDSDLKDVQRPWAFKAVTARVPQGGSALEIGGGIPVCAGALIEHGLRVLVVDPYEGAGHGPTGFSELSAQYPRVSFRRELFSPALHGLEPQSFDCIYSISTLEHIDNQEPIFEGIRRFLKPGGWSIHCVDLVLEGMYDAYTKRLITDIVARQRHLAGLPTDDQELDLLITRLRADLETFYLGPQGFHQWRRGLPYDEYPFLKVVSIETCARRAR